MATTAFNAQGTTIARESDTTPGSFVAIAEIRSFSGPGGTSAIIDATTLGSSGREKLMGLQDEGTLSLELNYSPTDSGQQALLADRTAQLRKQFKITFSNTATLAQRATATFFAYVTGFTIGGGVDALTTATVTLEITDSITWDFNGSGT
jgi:Lambda phage tail tube protein, TTP